MLLITNSSDPKFILAKKGRLRHEWYPLIDLLNKVNYGLDVDGRAKIASGILLSCQSLLNEKPLYKLCRRRLYSRTNIFTHSMISDIIHHRSIRFVFKSYHLSNAKKKKGYSNKIKEKINGENLHGEWRKLWIDSWQ